MGDKGVRNKSEGRVLVFILFITLPAAPTGGRYFNVLLFL